MGNSGFTRLYNPGEVVETRFNKIHDVPLLTLDRGVETLERFKNKQLLFVVLTPGSVFFKNAIDEIKAMQAQLQLCNI